MATRPWRGSLLYVGAAAAMTAAGVAKFAPAAQDVASAAAGSASSGAAAAAAPAETPTTDPSDTASSDTGSAAASPTETAPTSTSTGTTSATVTIVGAVEQNRYGSVQVSVTFQGSTITDVQTLQTPNLERESQRINEYAAPELAQEVIAAQSAQIDTVSGATYTSESYAQSVQSAIDQHG